MAEGLKRAFAGLSVALVRTSATAHGPLFSPVPETIWQRGTELTLGYHREEAGAEPEQEAFLEAEYGLTPWWEIGAELPTADEDTAPRLGSGSTDYIGGLATGYEGRRWYWFASGTYRLNTEGDRGLEQGDRQSLNLVGGVRPVLSEYAEPDTGPDVGAQLGARRS